MRFNSRSDLNFHKVDRQATGDRTSPSLIKSIFTKLAVVAGVASLAGCGQLDFGSGPFSGPATPPPQQAAAPAGTTFGSGPTRIALIVPLTQNGQPFVVGESLKNAAELAINDTGGTSVTLLVKDSGGNASGAQAAARAAVSEGAQLILGPLFANSVRAVGGVARPANRPVIAFSTDTSVASSGVYLLSFLVQSYVERVVTYAASRGKRSIAALVPNNAYGTVALGAFQEAASRRGIRVQAIERYSPGTLASAANRIGAVASQIDALFIPEQAAGMAAVSRALMAAGIDPSRVQVLGTGVWNDARVMKLPLLQGAWFSAPENAGFNNFAGRYRQRFNSDPARIATLAYDAVTLAVALAGQQTADKFGAGVLTNSAGFNGADGLFRFRPDGTNDRGLAVLEIRDGSSRVISQAPRSFTGGT